MSYWSHLDISTTICLHQMAAVGFEPMTLGFLRRGPTHCAIGADIKVDGNHHQHTHATFYCQLSFILLL